MTDILTFGIGRWIGPSRVLAVGDAPNVLTLASFTSDNSVADGSRTMTYGGFTSHIWDWQRIDLAAYDVPPDALVALIGHRLEIRHEGDTDPASDCQGAMWIYARPPGQAVERTGSWPMDAAFTPGTGRFSPGGQTAIFRTGDGVRTTQSFMAPLVDRAFEITLGYRNEGAPDRSLTRFRADISLRGFLLP